MYFTSGAKVQRRLANLEWSFEQGGCKYSVKEGAEGSLPADVPEVVAPLYKHATENLRKCRDIELAVNGLETQGSGATCFPIMAGKRHKFGGRHHQPSSSSSSTVATGSKSSGQKRDSVGKHHSRDHESPLSSLSNLCPTSGSPSLLQFPDSMKV